MSRRNFFCCLQCFLLSSCVNCNSFIQNLVASESAVSSLLLDSKIIISVCNVVSSLSVLPLLISGKGLAASANFCSASSFFFFLMIFHQCPVDLVDRVCHI